MKIEWRHCGQMGMDYLIVDGIKCAARWSDERSLNWFDLPSNASGRFVKYASREAATVAGIERAQNDAGLVDRVKKAWRS